MLQAAYLSDIKDELQRTGKTKKSLRVKTILNYFGYQRRSQAFVDDFNAALSQLGLCVTPEFDLYLPLDAKISIALQGVVPFQEPIVSATPTSFSTTSESLIPLHVKHDLFYYLFDFGSEQEYERFEACLDSNQPVGIFLVPLKDNFFSEVVVKILSYELVRKYQYRGSQGGMQASTLSLDAVGDSEGVGGGQKQNPLHTSNLFHFNESTMNSIILGSSGLDLLDSEKFDEQFQQLSLYANKYNTEQFFILFHCPPALDIQMQQREDLFGHLVDRIASQIPFTFTLRCRYQNEDSIKHREDIYSHLRVLLEVPNRKFEEDSLPLLDAFLDLQKTQVQAEAQLLLRMKPEHFKSLKWGWESDEHIYLKYFAIKTLENLGYSLSQIRCEVQLNSHQEDENGSEADYNRRPDVYVENKIIVEVETLRSRGFTGVNVFFDLTNRLLEKLVGWTTKLEGLWLVLPGFEIARNYYQLKKIQEILKDRLIQKYGESFRLLIMTPDYENHQLTPVSFDSIEYPSFENNSSKTSLPTNRICVTGRQKADFNQVQGLYEEKDKLKKLLRLQTQGLKSGIGGILLFGLPGCGKTWLAEAFANESESYFFKFTPAEIQSIWIGQSQKNIRDIFAQAKKKTPSVLFLDEIDSIGFSRDETQAHTDQKATINQLLIEFNNIRDSDVIVVAATNRLSGLDSALRRSGRLDWKIPIFPPDKNERTELFKHYLSSYLSKLTLPSASVNLDLVNYELLAAQSAKFTSSDVELVCREVRNAVLLGDINSELTTSDVITYITNIQDGGLTLNEEQVREFLDECQQLSVKSPKMNILREEWGI